MATYRRRAGRLNLSVVREDDFTVPLIFRNKTTRAVVDISDYTFTAEARTTDGTLVATFTDTIIDGPGGRLNLTLARAVTDTLPNSCKWDLEAVSATSEHQTWLTGTLTATGDVTDI